MAVALLPQILALMLLGAALDLLGGWNETDAGFGALLVLFLTAPAATGLLLAVEILRYRRLRRRQAPDSFLMPAVAMALLVEAVGLDLLVLFMVRMH